MRLPSHNRWFEFGIFEVHERVLREHLKYSVPTLECRFPSYDLRASRLEMTRLETNLGPNFGAHHICHGCPCQKAESIIPAHQGFTVIVPSHTKGGRCGSEMKPSAAAGRPRSFRAVEGGPHFCDGGPGGRQIQALPAGAPGYQRAAGLSLPHVPDRCQLALQPHKGRSLSRLIFPKSSRSLSNQQVVLCW